MDELVPERRKSVMRRLYDWTVHWAETRQATWALFILAFAESSFFPIPPDPLLMAMTTVRPEKYLRFATICTLASVVGGIAGYYIGVVFFETIGQGIVDFY
ncbi:MAG: DedA family protein, partial [Patescibacteria group bacterium]